MCLIVESSGLYTVRISILRNNQPKSLDKETAIQGAKDEGFNKALPTTVYAVGTTTLLTDNYAMQS